MDAPQFANCLRDAVIGAVRAFRRKFPSESPYGFAILRGSGDQLMYAIATEEQLRRVASEYHKLGYRCQGFQRMVDNRKGLANWLRWSNPDDGWHCGEFSPRVRVVQCLEAALRERVFGDEGEQLEEFYTIVLTSLQSDPNWQRMQSRHPIVVGVTSGEDPRDFLRTATRCNPYAAVENLWSEHFLAEELASRIERPQSES